jgi:hypothetical protein
LNFFLSYLSRGEIDDTGWIATISKVEEAVKSSRLIEGRQNSSLLEQIVGFGIWREPGSPGARYGSIF